MMQFRLDLARRPVRMLTALKEPAAGLVVLIGLAIVLGYGSLFVVEQTEQVLVLRLGDPIRVITEPGLKFKVPFVDTTVSIDKRILGLENPSHEIIASDQKRMLVGAFTRYRIARPLEFYQTAGSIEAVNVAIASLLDSSLRRVLGEATSTDLVRDRRDALMVRIREQLDRDAEVFGVSIVDVRIRRADLPDQNSQSIYSRMQTERQREAQEFRAVGDQWAQEIRSRADREATVIVAKAAERAEEVRGDGDAERNRIFAAAYGERADFFAFYRSMAAYEVGLSGATTRFLLKPDSDFFRFFGDSQGRSREAR
jgi:membrane protease subunit HflC